jgi:hypothetical protein
VIRAIVYCCIGIAALFYAWFRQRRTVSPLVLAPILLAVANTAYVQISQRPFPEPLKVSQTFDEVAYYADGSFGGQPSVVVNQLTRRLPGSQPVLWFTYESLFMALLLCCALFVGHRDYWRVVGAFTLAAAVGICCYRLFPACGPAYLLGDDCYYGTGTGCGYMVSGQPQVVDMELRFPRNAMPSLHMAWALLIWFFLRGRRRLEWIGLVYCFLIGLSTLAFGEHYLIDLCAAFPFALAVWAAFTDSFTARTRSRIAICSLVGYLLWIVTVRFFAEAFWRSPVFPWAAAVASTAIPAWVVLRSGTPSHDLSRSNARTVQFR